MARNAFVFCEKRVLFSHGTVVIDAGELYGPWCWKLPLLVEKGHLINTSKICALQNTGYLCVHVSFECLLGGVEGQVFHAVLALHSPQQHLESINYRVILPRSTL